MNKLKDPPKQYRAVPFWSWNDKLDPEMLKWQVREMDKAGLGGYFMHARGGLQTEYMSDEWMECIKACIDEGNKLGMNSWCYDENGWPSGFASGIVTAMGDKFHVRWLEIKKAPGGEIAGDESILGIYTLDSNETVIVRQKSNPYYIDILNKDVVKAFIEATHEKYYSLFKEDFGKGMPGFFTDEPQFSREQIPWSYIIPGNFKGKYGYNILDKLPALFLECEGYEKVRYDFWNLVSELYVTSFGKQIYDWCNAHDCMLTGHVMQEDGLYIQMTATAGAMPFYEYMHTPGMDWLGRKISSPVIPKQVSSVANQLGKKFVLSETFALCGWDVSFEELKWIAEWQYVNGVNLMCQHLEGYTLRGLRKRDYPPSLFYQQSWWDEYKLFNDYFARLGVLLTSGKNGAKVLLIHPIKSGWIVYNHSNNDTLVKLDNDFINATEVLSGLHFEHHYGDETLIGKYGKVEENRFIVGECDYNVVVLPSMITIDGDTLELLNRFIDNGGKVISIGDFPTLCSGVPDNRVALLKERVISVGEDRALLYKALEQTSLSTISISDKNGEISSIHHQQRDLGNTQAYFIVNHDQLETFDAVITIKGRGKMRRYSAENSEIFDTAYSIEGENTRLSLQFLPMQSYVIIFDTEEEKCNNAVNVKESGVVLGDNWDVEEVDLNSLTLDYCSYSVDNGEWLNPVPTINLMGLLLNMRKNCDIALKFNFQVEMDLNKNNEIFMVAEKIGEFEIFVNGQKVKYSEQGWWKDTEFKKMDIKPFVKLGNNEIIMKRRFYQSKKVYDVLFGENVLETEKNKLTYDVELESIYIVGDFGVISKSVYTYGDRKAIFNDGPFTIADKPEKVKTGDLTEHGFCFFAGKIKLSQEMKIKKSNNERIIVTFTKPNAIISKVFVNDKPVKLLPWAPFKVDITDYINDGNNKLAIQLFAGNRNLLGPHHHARGEVYAVCTTSFSDEPGWGEEEAEGKWKDRYCFVKFGLEK